MSIKEQIDALVKYMHTVPHDSNMHQLAANTIKFLNKKEQQSDEANTKPNKKINR